MKYFPDRIDGKTVPDDGFYSRKAKRNDEDIEKFVRLMRSIAASLGILALWKWMIR
jgi:hypothetical protein